MRTRRDAPLPPAGFTLIEILVVLTIVALAMIAVPSVMAGLPTIRLRAAADEMSATLGTLRDQAIRRGASIGIVFDAPDRSYTLTNEATRHDLPAIVDTVTFQPTIVLGNDRLARVVFFPDGSATGGTLLLSHAGQAIPITIDWLSGRIRRP